DAVDGAGAAVHPQSEHVVLQMNPVEHGIDAVGTDRLKPDAAGKSGGPVVVDDGVGDEELGVAGRLHQDPEPAQLDIPDHAVLDVHGRGLTDHDAACGNVMPIDDEAAQADDVANSGANGDADAGGWSRNASLTRSVVGDADRLIDDHRAVVARI